MKLSIFSKQKKFTLELLKKLITLFFISGGMLTLLLLFQNFTPVTAPGPIGPFYVSPVGQYANFQNACFKDVIGWNSLKNENILGNERGDCAKSNGNPLLFTVTHETTCNSQTACGDMPKSLNQDDKRGTYMDQYDVKKDIGRWVNNGFYKDFSGNSILAMSYDSLNFNDTNSISGWPVRYGHLFYGLIDLSSGSSLDHNVYVEFDIRIRGNQVGAADIINRTDAFPNGFSGYHIVFGTTVNWVESDVTRKNQAHTFEIVLHETPGYGRTYGDITENDPHCRDAIYDRCFFNQQDGSTTEGKYLSYSRYLKNSPLSLNTDQWTHVRIPFSDVLKSLNWVSKPISWAQAKFVGVYFAIESMGATRAWIEIKNYRIYNADPLPSVLKLPMGFIRLGQAGLLSYPSGICQLQDGNMMKAYSWTQSDYDRAPQIQPNQIPAGYRINPCQGPSNGVAYRGIFRVGNGGYLQRGQFYCSILSSQQMTVFGFNQANYDNAPQVFVPDTGLIYTGSCW